MKSRQKLQGDILLCGKRGSATFQRTFTVTKKLSADDSSICYEAYDENGEQGLLKEFYPQNDRTAMRNSLGQLVHSPYQQAAWGRFGDAEYKFTKAHELLNAKRNERQVLFSFVPPFTIYHGYDEYGEPAGTTYIWMPGPPLETFDTLCSAIHRYPTSAPEHKLVAVLLAVRSIARGIGDLHDANVLHRDIKPSAFSLVKRSHEPLPQGVTMFDMGTVCLCGDIELTQVGTAGYQEPESAYKAPTKQTDIYAIGATLFHAIVVTDETKTDNYLYKPAYYDRLRELVNESRLIQASEANAHPRLRDALTTILQKCLCQRSDRYQSCDELLEDLEIALYCALPSGAVKELGTGTGWELAAVAKYLDRHKSKNSFLTFQYHLYEHPLYWHSSEDELHVLVVGFW